MKRRILFSLSVLAIHSSLVLGQELKEEYQTIVAHFIDCVKNDQVEDVANMFSYPFRREYPIPSIKDKEEFKRRYCEVFDDTLKRMIVRSNPATDWLEMGWRGIMLHNGDLWIDFDGRVIAINYQSRVETQLRDKLIMEDKRTLHPSLSSFYKPLWVLETSKFRIRIDDLGDYKYRYASWNKNSPMSEKPALVLTNGEVVVEGTGGNHSYLFRNGDYVYECAIIVMGEDDSPPARLTVYKADKEILKQNATIIGK